MRAKRGGGRVGIGLLGLAALAGPQGRSTVVRAAGEMRPAQERRLSFDAGWRFHLGEASGAESPGFDDATWRAVDLPHDWAIEQPFDPKLNPHTGALPAFGVAWYRKRFTVPTEAKARYHAIEFDG